MTHKRRAPERPGELARRLKRIIRIGFAVGVFMAVFVGIIQPQVETLLYLIIVIGVLGLLLVVLPHFCRVKKVSVRLVNYILLISSLGFGFVLSELGLRIFWTDPFIPFDDERSLLYRYDPVLGWFPKANTRRSFTGSRTVEVTHNAEGFRDSESKDANEPAFVFLGDSFVWGYDAEANERFTDKFQARHPEIRVRNMGVSGYGTDQSFLVLQQQMEKLTPKFVFLVFSENDDEDNSSNVLYGTYYKPYFTCEGDTLKLKGVPVPPAERAFRVNHRLLCSSQIGRLLVRAYFHFSCPPPQQHKSPTSRILLEMQKYLQQRDVFFAVGFTSPQTNFQAVLKAANVPYLDLSTTNRYGGIGHWTPKGHDFVCDAIENFLIRTPSVARFLRNSKGDANSYIPH